MSRLRCLLILSALLLMPWSSQAQQMLRVALPERPATLDPHRAVTSAEHILARELFVGLLMHNADGHLISGLAESWTISPDGLAYRFELKRGLVWSDGQRLDADDIVASIERALDPDTAAPFVAELSVIKNAEAFRLGTLPSGEKLGVAAVGRGTVEFQLNAPSQKFLGVLAQPIAAPVPRHRIAALKDAWASPLSLVGNGAFVVAPKGDAYGLKRNPRFFDAAGVALNEIDLVTDAAGADLALGFPPTPQANGAPETYQLLVNVTKGPLAQREVRHALGMLINRAELIQSLNVADATPAYSFVPNPPQPSYQAAYAGFTRDDARVVAEALMLDTNPRTAPPLRYAYPEGPFHANIAVAVAQSWRAFGFTVDLIARPAADHEQAVLNGDFDVAVAPPWRRGDGADAYLFRFSQAAGPWNAGRYREPEFENHLTRADQDPFPESRQAQWREAEGVLIGDQAAWPLFFYAAGPGPANDLAGLKANSATIHPLRTLAKPSR